MKLASSSQLLVTCMHGIGLSTSNKAGLALGAFTAMAPGGAVHTDDDATLADIMVSCPLSRVLDVHHEEAETVRVALLQAQSALRDAFPLFYMLTPRQLWALHGAVR